ncbi:hypothetical protein GYMLUDRAFT_33905 [Collybiopsis luxurians FD-317 M1]|nr:hypothetical protein GYMLUDRAFT_33905 [Collybiopsis luxurians FD-317 M1]
MRASRHTFFALSLFFNCISAQTFSVQYPPTIVDEDSITQYIASSSFDGAKVTSVNASSYDWWYFDVVSLDHTYSAVVVFYTAPNTSFPFLPDGKNILAAQISLQTPDAGVLAFNTAYANAATLTVGGDDTDIQGDWEGVGAAFTGAENLTLYNVTFDAEEELGVTGFISFNSVSRLPNFRQSVV